MSFFRSLQFRLLLLLSLVGIIPIALVSFSNLNTTAQLVEEEVQARQIEVTQIIHDQVTQFMNEIVIHLETMGRSTLVLGLDRDGINDYVLTYLEPSTSADNTYNSIWLIDAEGNELGGIANEISGSLASGHIITAADLKNRSEDEIFIRPQNGEIYFSAVRLDGGRPQLSIGLPIYNFRDEFVGVVAAIIDLQSTWAIIQELQLGEGGYAMLLDESGNIIVHGDEDVQIANYNFLDAPPYSSALSASPLAVYEYESPISGAVIGSALPIPGPHWILMLERPEREAYAAISQAQNNIYLGIAFALLVALGISLLLARRVANPIVHLRDAVQRFGAGHLTVRSNLKSNDEIGQLAEGFNTMADRLKSRIEEIDEKNKELQEANVKVLESARLKDEFLAVMSHELRTPLNAIIGFSGILLMDEELAEKQAFQVQRIETNSERLLQLINDILDISRIQAGRMTFNPSPLDIRRLVNRIHEQLEVLAKSKKIDFVQTIAEDIPKLVSVDEDALIKILTNLSSNAIKFTASGSVHIDLSRDGANLLIRVTDTGIGIPPQMHEIIFEEFRQADSSSMRSYGGTGLGLAIVRRLSVAMGGGVSLKSKVNEGSSFTVTLPLLTEPERELAN